MPRRCRMCRKSKGRNAFSKEQWRLDDGKGCCSSCHTRRCMKCLKEKGISAFSRDNWQLPEGSAGVYCKHCALGGRKEGMWTCHRSDCKKQLPKEDFSVALKRYSPKQLTQGKYHVCNRCLALSDAQTAAIAEDNVKHVAKLRMLL